MAEVVPQIDLGANDPWVGTFALDWCGLAAHSMVHCEWYGENWFCLVRASIKVGVFQAFCFLSGRQGCKGGEVIPQDRSGGNTSIRVVHYAQCGYLQYTLNIKIGQE